MNAWTIALSTALALVVATADAQTPVRLRGTIAALDGNVLLVKSRDGRDVKVQLADNVAVAVATRVAFDDIRKGDYVGATTKSGPGGTLVALEVHYLAPTTPEGHIPWDLEPETMMTNASVDSIVQATGKRELTLQYKGGSKVVVVPESAPIVRAVPGTRADLVPGEYVFLGATAGADGVLATSRVQVSKAGVRPPQ
jgi:hypothetical protein